MSLKQRRAARTTRANAHDGADAARAAHRDTEPRLGTDEPRWHVVELGSFSHGECLDCRWRGPGRRARGSARKDAELHALAGCGDLAQVRDLFAEDVPVLD